MFYAGGSFAYLSGDDPGTTDKVEGGVNTGGLDWNPCLIMFNNDLNYWAGNIYGYDGSELDGEMSNAWFFQGRVGVKPTPKWDIMLAVSYAMADKKPAGYPNGTYGTEVDLTATYKITNNLTYTLGGGYLFTGDYFKGYDNGQPVGTVHYVYYRGTLEHTRDSRNFTVISNDTDNDFMIMNKLTLSF